MRGNLLNPVIHETVLHQTAGGKRLELAVSCVCQARRNPKCFVACHESGGECKGVRLETEAAILVGEHEESLRLIPEARTNLRRQFLCPLFKVSLIGIVAEIFRHHSRVFAAHPEQDVHVGTVRRVAEIEVAGVLGGLGPLNERAVFLRVRAKVIHELHHIRVKRACCGGIAGIKVVVMQNGNKPGGKFVRREWTVFTVLRRRRAFGVGACVNVSGGGLVEAEQLHRASHIRFVSGIEGVEEVALRPPEVAAPDEPVSLRSVCNIRKGTGKIPLVETVRRIEAALPVYCTVAIDDLDLGNDRPRLLLYGEAETFALANLHGRALYLVRCHLYHFGTFVADEDNEASLREVRIGVKLVVDLQGPVEERRGAMPSHARRGL